MGVLSHRLTLVIGPLAQLVEQLTLNQLVEGSNPSRPTTMSILGSKYLGKKMAILVNFGVAIFIGALDCVCVVGRGRYARYTAPLFLACHDYGGDRVLRKWRNW